MSELESLRRRVQELEIENLALKQENEAYRTKLEELVAVRTQEMKSALADLDRSYDITLQALGDALDLKDATTENHSRRVTAYTIAIAKKMNVPMDDIRVIARGAFLHDIGKLAMPENILFKPGKLTREEFEVMKEHAWYGYKMLRNTPVLAAAAEIVYAHQEHFDGTGYPRGLKGEAIPLGARIVAVANTLDSILSDRPYRPKQSHEAARKEIKTWSGRQFDPRVVDAFLSMPDDLWEQLRGEANG